MKKTFNIGDRVSVMIGSGIDSGKTGYIVPNDTPKPDYIKSFDPKREVVIKTDAGEIITMFKNRVIRR
jgi:hypothetical protein